MKSLICSSKLLAAALCGVLLAGCNLVEDVPEKAYGKLPIRRQAIQGTVKGLGSERSIVLVNNGANPIALTAVTLDTPANTDTGPLDTETHFSFGAFDVTDASGKPVTYNVTIKEPFGTPYGRSCVVHNGSGTLSEKEPPGEVLVECTPNVPRYDLTVVVDPAFSSSKDPRVRLTTEEGIYEVTPLPGQTSVKFKQVLINAATAGSNNGTVPTPAPPPNSETFVWTVSASNMEGGSLSKCPVTNPTNPFGTGAGAAVLQNPTGHTSGPVVGACALTVSGRVHYSLPATVTAAPTLGAGGLTLELRDQAGNFKAKQDITGTSFPVDFTFNTPGTTTPLPFRSNASSVFQVVVTRQPAGQTCVVNDGGHASLQPLISNTPAVLIRNNPQDITAFGTNTLGVKLLASATGAQSVFVTPGTTALSTVAPQLNYVLGSRLVVFCRNAPTGNNVLKGTYRLSKQTALIAAATNSTTFSTRTSEWLFLDVRTQNTATAGFLQLFDDGTFLYANSGASTADGISATALVQLEHGFYEYNDANQTLRFTRHTDTNPSTTFRTTPTDFGVINEFVFRIGPPTYTPGLSASPGSFVVSPVPTGTNPAPLRHEAMCNVQKVLAPLPPPIGTTKRITGSFGGTTTQCGGVTSNLAGLRQLNWELTEPHNIDGEMTGAWITQDHRRMWVFDGASTYGTHIGVPGAPTMQNACFTMEDYHSSDGYYTRRGSSTGCLAWNRPAANQSPAYSASGAEALDWPAISQGTLGTPGGVPWLQSLPGWTGRIPGGASAFDGRSPSAARFVVAKPADFFAKIATGDAATVALNKLFFPQTEDTNGNGVLDGREDVNNNGNLDAGEDTNGNGLLDYGEDDNRNGVLDVVSFAWCTTEILALRATSNGIPIDKPVYFCRNTWGASQY